MKIAVACGGTGGHIFPGLVTAGILRGRGHDVSLWLAGKPGEQAAVKDWDGPLVTVQAQGFEARRPLRHPIQTLETIFRLGGALRGCIARMKTDRPNVVLAMGSYAVVGPVGAALRLGIPYVLHESNVLPGRAISLLSKSARVVAVQFDETRFYLKRKDLRLVGMPLRKELEQAASRSNGKHPEGRPFTVLIMGGSKGAKDLNDIGAKALCMSQLKGHPFLVIHLTGERQVEEVRGMYATSGVDAEVHAFTHDMASAYGKADFAVCRAGAATCAELCLFGMPSLLVPYPFAAKDHQMANARAMERAGAADVVPQRDLTISWLASYLVSCSQSADRLQRMRQSARGRATPNAAEALADLVEEVGKQE
jgi:UDP-N-acetylglucosamine--N-acetylmuramyl-(pentapeptide) pyrophosphoryl-undecaprenol N-acetylglucosamine transferase